MLLECLRTLKTAERETRFSINAPGLSHKVTSHQKAHRRFWRCGANLISPLGSLKSAIGTKRTNEPDLMKSVARGNSEVAVRGHLDRFCPRMCTSRTLKMLAVRISFGL